MIRLEGPDYVSLYAMARLFDLTPLLAGRLHTAGLVRGYEVAPRVWRYPLADVERVANTHAWYGSRVRQVVRRELARFPRDHTGYRHGERHAG